MKRLLVNDALSQLGERTFWSDLLDWFGCDFVGCEYSGLPGMVDYHLREKCQDGASLIIRNATYFPPLKTNVPTISLLQDIITEGPQREMQEAVIKSSRITVFNSAFTVSKYENVKDFTSRVISLPVDFDIFQPGNAMGLQQSLALPNNCICWVGASQGAAGNVKGWDIFLSIVRTNPDLQFVAVFKDEQPEYAPLNLRMFTRLKQHELARVIGACRVGLCTSRMESQHLAGIEMGACGLPLVVPPVGCYWNRTGGPGVVVSEQTPDAYNYAIRAVIGGGSLGADVWCGTPEQIRGYWEKEFSQRVVRDAWTKLIEEVECS